MKTRILIVDYKTSKETKFVPQYEVSDNVWAEFIAYEEGSPYLHMKQFPTREAASTFLLGGCANISPGEHAWGRASIAS